MSEGFTLTRLSRLTARLVSYDWPWARENEASIAENWARRRAERPAMFDGRVLLACDYRIEGECCEVDLFETSFARFLATRDFGAHEAGVFNAFAALVPMAHDGTILLGVMAGHTANAGQIYFPCGTPDLGDVVARGHVDLAGSALREFAEETGIALDRDGQDGASEGNWVFLRGEGQYAFLRPVVFPEDAEALLARMEGHRRTETAPELAGFVTVRGPGQIDPARMPGFVRAYLADVYG